MKTFKKFQLRLVHLLMLSFVAIALLALKFVLYHNTYLAFMVWNLFLAWLPIPFAMLFARCKKRICKGATFLVWLLFLPNAPYLLTDLVHPFRFYFDYYGMRKPPIHDSLFTYEFLMILFFALVGFLLAYASIEIVTRALFSKHPKKKRRTNESLFIFSIGLLGGLGIFIGRFLRFNSWDVVTNPIELIQETVAIFLDPLAFQALMTVIAVTVLIFCGGYLLYRWIFEFRES